MTNSKFNTCFKEITPLSNKDCLYIVERLKKEFNYPLHTHDECELNFIENAQGAKRIVGDSNEEIGNYELVLITSKDLEHTWEQNNCISNNIREITIQFSPLLFPKEFIEKDQFRSINKMFELAKNGLAFSTSSIMKIYSQLDNLASEKEQGFYTVLKFLSIMYELSQFPDSRQLASNSFAKREPIVDSRRIMKVQNYIDHNFNQEIKLDELAVLAGMTKTSFCRFFKLRTGRSVIDYVLSVRLGHASRMLLNTTHTIIEIAYICGFNNQSNFNRIFRNKKGVSPKEFREKNRRIRLLI
jgi:AraC-like DNA-binding protein